MGFVLCVLCVYVYVNFLFYRGSSVRVEIVIRIFSEKKKTEKKLVNSHESVWETTNIVSGKLPCSLSKNIFWWFIGKVQTQCPN